MALNNFKIDIENLLKKIVDMGNIVRFRTDGRNFNWWETSLKKVIFSKILEKGAFSINV